MKQENKYAGKNNRYTIYNTTHQGGDTIIEIDGAATLIAVGAIFLASAGVKAIATFIDTGAHTLKTVVDTVSRPDLKPYFITMAILVIIILAGLAYLAIKHIKDEDDIDWDNV